MFSACLRFGTRISMVFDPMAYQGRGEWEGIHCLKLCKGQQHPHSRVSPSTGARNKQLSVDTCSVTFSGPQWPTVCHSDEAEKIVPRIATF